MYSQFGVTEDDVVREMTKAAFGVRRGFAVRIEREPPLRVDTEVRHASYLALFTLCTYLLSLLAVMHCVVLSR